MWRGDWPELRLDWQRPAKESLVDDGANEFCVVWKAAGGVG